MKKNYIHTTCILALLGAMAAGLWGCQTDDLAEQGGTAPQAELQLTVIDGGYTTHQALSYEDGTLHELPQTRATESGYKTTFAAGDKIGLYALDANDKLLHTNTLLTLTDVGGGKQQWKPNTNVKLSTTAQRYFAYYPYQSSLSGTLDNTATTADEFFANVISKWTPGTNQSTTYPSKDLMVGSGTLGTTPVNGSYPLTITLTHKMGLAVITLPTGATDVTFHTNIPYKDGATGQYRYLLKPATPTNLSCSFTDGGEVRGFVIAATIAGGQYKTYNVKGKPPVPMSFGIDLTSYSTDKTYILPFKTTGTTGSYTLTVDWGDGSQTTNIPAGTKLTTTTTTKLLTHTYAEAKAYTITISSPQTDFSKEQIPGFKPGSYRSTTQNNNKLKLKSVDTPLLNTGEADFTNCFNGCTNLTGSISENLFINNPQVTIFKNCFAGCAGLTGAIPAGLFARNHEVITFDYVFNSCSKLTSIPSKLFENNKKAESFEYAFLTCSSLSSIPSGLFDNNSKVKNFKGCFEECSNLTGAIPAGLFDKNTEVTDFSSCFKNCMKLTGSIPAGLFDKNTYVTTFSNCFMYCENLTSIPEKLFANNLLVTDFSYCFAVCSKLTMNANIFCEETSENKATRFKDKSVNFNYCFKGVGSDNSVTSAGTAPALWDGYAGTLKPDQCFNGVDKATNTIPSEWKD